MFLYFSKLRSIFETTGTKSPVTCLPLVNDIEAARGGLSG